MSVQKGFSWTYLVLSERKYRRVYLVYYSFIQEKMLHPLNYVKYHISSRVFNVL